MVEKCLVKVNLNTARCADIAVLVVIGGGGGIISIPSIAIWLAVTLAPTLAYTHKRLVSIAEIDADGFSVGATKNK